MEGHITAIGAVTQESGNVIGNSLKTIYSRITTLDDAKAILESVGVAIYKMGEDGQKTVRPVNDILSDLASKWASLTDEQRQNIAVQIAGRYQLSRFLALMNNWQTAVAATQTALTSQGSAMRENDKYLNSYQARINKLKDTFTELSLAVGDSVLNGAIFAAIEGLGKLAEIGISLTKEFGALPVVMGGLGFVLSMMGTFKGVTKEVGALLKTMRDAFVEASAGATTFRGVLTGTAAAGKSLEVMLPTLTAGVKAFGNALKAVALGTVYGAIFVGIGVAIEKIVAHFQKSKQVAEEVEKTNRTLIDSYRNTAGGLENLVNKYAELQDKVDSGQIREGTEAYNEYLKVNQELAKRLPTMVKYIDAKGVAHLKEAEAMKKEVEVAKKLSEIDAEKTVKKYNENLQKRIDKISELTEKTANLNKKIKDLESENGEKIKGTAGDVTIDNTDKIQKNKIEALNAYREIYKNVQSINSQIKETVSASLEASGKLKWLSDTQRSAVESIITNNEHFLTDIAEKMANTTSEKEREKLSKELQDRANDLFEAGQEVGNMLANKVKEMTKGLVDENEIEKVKADFDNLIKALPKDFFDLKSLDNIDEFKKRLNGVLSVADQIKNGATNFNDLADSLEHSGFTAEEAKGYVANLGFQYDNASIKAEALRQQSEGLIDDLGEYIDTAIQATDVTENLFGYNGNDINALKSHIETLQGLQYIYGKNAEKTDAWKKSIEDVSKFLGIEEDKIKSNLPHLYEMVDLLQNIKLKHDETGRVIGFETSNLTKEQKQTLDHLRELGITDGQIMDILTGRITDLNGAMDENTNKMNENKNAAQQNSQATLTVADAIDTLKGKFKDLKDNMNADTKSAYIETVKSQLNAFSDEITTVKDKAGNLKLSMTDEQHSKYLDTLMKQLEDLGMKISVTKDKAGNLKIVLNDGKDSQTLTTIKKNAEDAKQSIDGATRAMELLQQKKLPSKVANQPDFYQVTKDAQEAYDQVQSLSDALKSVDNNISSIYNIQTALGDLSKKVGGVKDALEHLLDGTGGDISAIAQKASEAKSKVDALRSSIKKVVVGEKIVNLNWLDTLKDDLAKAKKYVSDLSKALSSVPKASKSMANSASSAAKTAKSAIDKQRAAVEKLDDTYKKVGKAVSSSFNQMKSKVTTNTNKMISVHNSQKKAIDKLSDAARDARKNIQDLNSSAKSAMDVLDVYIAKAKKARDAGNKVPTPSFGGLFGGTPIGARGVNGTLNSNITQSINAFTATAEGVSSESSSSFASGGEGTSGFIRPSIYEGYYDLDGNYNVFKMLASKKEEKEEPYKVDSYERSLTSLNASLNALEAKMERIAKNSITYRDALKKALSYQNSILALEKKQLSSLEKRNAEIQRQLKRLPSVSKQNAKQREEYNKLQQEYDSNLSKIASLKQDIESLTTDIRNRSLEIFNDFVDEIVGKYDAAIKALQDKADDIDFKLNVLELTKPDDVKDKLNLLAQKANNAQQEEATTRNKRNDLQSQYNAAVKKYGKNSDQAKKLKEALDEANEELEDATIKALQAEKEIMDTRGEVADKGIQQLKDYYSTMKDLALQAIDKEKEELEKAHNEKMKMYDEEIDKINKVYDDKLKQMDKEKSEREYQEQLDEKNQQRADLVNKITLLSRDTSLEGRKKVEDLKKQLADLDKEIADMQQEHQDELLRQQLEDQRQQQIDAVNAQKDQEDQDYNNKVDELDKQKDEVSKKYDDILNDEKYWADMRNKFISGSFSQLNDELKKMSDNLNQMSKGNFDSLLNNFSSFSDEVKKQFAELNGLTIDNLIFESGSVIDQANQVSKTNYKEYTGHGTDYDIPKINSTTSTSQPKPSGSSSTSKPKTTTSSKKPPKVGGKVKVVASNADAFIDAYGHEVKPWAQQAKAAGIKYDQPLYLVNSKNGYGALSKTKNVKDAIAWVRLKDLVGLRSGGYTGDWIGNDGKLAILHKKELVLNEKQTDDILDTAKIIKRISDVMPNLKRIDLAKQLGTNIANNATYNYNFEIIFEKPVKRDDAEYIAQKIMEKFRKRGK